MILGVGTLLKSPATDPVVDKAKTELLSVEIVDACPALTFAKVMRTINADTIERRELKFMFNS